MLKVTWDEAELMKHELQKIRNEVVQKHSDLALLNRCNYCLQILNGWILKGEE